MCYSKMDHEEINKLKANMHRGVETFCNRLKNASEHQVDSALQDMANKFEEAVVNTVVALSKREDSAPLLLKEQQELRCEVQRRALKSEGPGDQQPEESFCNRVLRFFRSLLQRLQDVLTWVKEKTAPLRNAVRIIWEEIKSFFSSVFSESGSCCNTCLN